VSKTFAGVLLVAFYIQGKCSYKLLYIRWHIMSNPSLGPYQLNTIIKGNFMDVAKSLPSQSVDLIITSPPYNQKLSSMSAPTGHHKGDTWFASLAHAYADDMPEEDYQDWQVECLKQMLRVVKRDGLVCYNHKLRFRKGIAIHPLSWIWRSGALLKQEIIWDRRGSLVQNARMWAPSDERIFILRRPDSKQWTWNSNEWAKGTSVWVMPPSGSKDTDHPCAFPLSLPMRLISCLSNPGELVLDPFAGSGTTLIAASRLSRRYLGIDKDDRYVKMARRRLEDDKVGQLGLNLQ